MSESTNDTEIRLRARLLRGLRAAILASRRTPDTGQIACRRRALRRHFLNVTRRTVTTSNSRDSYALRSDVLCEIHRPGDLLAFTPSTLLIYVRLKQVIFGILISMT